MNVEYPLSLNQLYELLKKYSDLLEDFDKKMIATFSNSRFGYTSLYLNANYDRMLIAKTLDWLNITKETYGKNVIYANQPSFEMYHQKFDEKSTFINGFFSNLQDQSYSLNSFMKLEFTGEFRGEVGFLIESILTLLIKLQHIHLRTLPKKDALNFIEEKLYQFEVSNIDNPLLSVYEKIFRESEIKNLELLKNKILKDSKQPKNELLDSLINAIIKLQGLQRNMLSGEKARTQMLASLLNNFVSKDESGFGLSESGKTIGEPDIKIENYDGSIKAICEGYNLTKSLDRSKINSHVNKVFKYDLSGLTENYIFIFSGLIDFTTKWKSYLTLVTEIDTGFEFTGMEDLSEKYESLPANIRIAKFNYIRENKEISIVHIFIKMESIKIK